MRATMGRRAYPSESLGSAMGRVGTLDPAAIAGWQAPRAFAARARQCHPLRAAQRLSVATRAPRFPGLGDRLLLLPALVRRRGLGSSA